jgi:glycosyltransferase involved in cell wall biosynthesis
MNIAIFTNNYLPNPYGVAGSIESFRLELEKMGHTVYVFAPETKGYVNENKNVFFYPALNLKFKNIAFPIAIPYSYSISRILEKLEIDIIHSQHPNLLGWEASRWAKKKNVPLVFTWHTLYDQYAHFVPFFVPQKIATWWTIKNAVSYANQSDQVIIPTRSVREIIQAWGVTNENIVAIPTGVSDFEITEQDRENARHEFEIEADQIVITLISRLTVEKNVLFLAKNVAKLLEENEKLIFALAGGGSELEEMRKILTNEKIGNRFRYFGVVSGKEKRELHALSDIFVYASKSETQGMVLTEAMSAGLPIVGLSATGVSDIVVDGQTGFLTDENGFSNSILKLVTDEKMRHEFGENAKNIARNEFSSRVCAEKMLATYQKVLIRK